MSPQRVARHSFYPFLGFNQRWSQFAAKGGNGKIKERPICYAARLDACIFSYYRHLLSIPYEQRLIEEDLDSSILAYRRITKSQGLGGKCNIDFAHDAFRSISSFDHCCAITLDISSYFQSIDHETLKRAWCDIIGSPSLPDDHYAVFKAITRYSVVDKISAYERLGYFGIKSHKNGKPIPGYLCRADEIPTQLCHPAEFRTKIAGQGTLPSIVKPNNLPHGIPQGAPLSDLLANLYLLEFDKLTRKRAESVGGSYFRYSDDILIIAPIDPRTAFELESEIRASIASFGPQMFIKEEKSSIHWFRRDGVGHRVATLKPMAKQEKRFEYLGFRFDGHKVYVRDKTLSALHRKIASTCKLTAYSLVKRYRGRSRDDILNLYNIESLYQRFGRVDSFHEKADDLNSWTFWTYVNRAVGTFGELGSPIGKQVRRLRKHIRNRLVGELDRILS